MQRNAPVGIIGLGLMGTALSERLIGAGVAVVGFDIDSSRCDALRDNRGKIATSAGELAGQCRAIVIAVYDGAQLEVLLGELEKVPARPAIICTTTCAPDEIVRIAARATQVAGKPWVLDPVGAGATAFRDKAVAALLAHKPSIIRGNASEIMAVARIAGHGDTAARPKGVDSANTVAEAEALAIALSRAQNCVVAATGAVDFVTDGKRHAHIGNGSQMMTFVTALGCALSALTAAFATAGEDRFATTCAALIAYGIAGEMAEENSDGPGSFRMMFLDMLYRLDAEDFVMNADFSA